MLVGLWFLMGILQQPPALEFSKSELAALYPLSTQFLRDKSIVGFKKRDNEQKRSQVLQPIPLSAFAVGAALFVDSFRPNSLLFRSRERKGCRGILKRLAQSSTGAILALASSAYGGRILLASSDPEEEWAVFWATMSQNSKIVRERTEALTKFHERWWSEHYANEDWEIQLEFSIPQDLYLGIPTFVRLKANSGEILYYKAEIQFDRDQLKIQSLTYRLFRSDVN